jgi:hypothetical protein
MVNNEISLETIKSEILVCKERGYDWSFSEPDETSQTLLVEMHDKFKDKYIVFIQFDNYKQWPLLIDFKDPITGEVGVRTAYPYNSDSFFNREKTTICHPYSRKAYKGHTSLHADWGQWEGWQSVRGIGTLRSLLPILESIFIRLHDDTYQGRMEKRA